MRRFAEYYVIREQEEGGMDGTAPASNIEPSVEGQTNAFKIALNKYPEEAKKFLNDLAAQDEEVRQALQGGGDNSEDGPVDHDKEQEKDEVKPPAADGSPGLTMGQGE